MALRSKGATLLDLHKYLPAPIANTIREGRRPGLIFCICLIAILSASIANASSLDEPGSHSVLIYYGNETSERAQANSSNLKRLRTLLRQSKAPIAARLSSIIEADLTDFRAQVGRDRADLLAAAQRIGFDLAIFTNTLAQTAQYMFYRHDVGLLETRPFPQLPPAASEILSLSALSRPEALKAALSSVAAHYEGKPLNIALVTLSHGSLDMALMPRVNSDLSTPHAVDEFKRNLQRGGNGVTPEWATPQGTGKIAYWDVLADISKATGARFPLVFRQACGSGPNGWREFMRVPSTITTIAHTGRYNIDIDQIDYAELFAPGAPGSDWLDLLTTGLKQREITVSSQFTIGLWALLSTLINTHPAVFLVPLLLWLAVFGARALQIVKLRLRPA